MCITIHIYIYMCVYVCMIHMYVGTTSSSETFKKPPNQKPAKAESLNPQARDTKALEQALEIPSPNTLGFRAYRARD